MDNLETRANKRLRKPKRQSKCIIQRHGQINVRENRRGNQNG